MADDRERQALAEERAKEQARALALLAEATREAEGARGRPAGAEGGRGLERKLDTRRLEAAG